MVSQSIYYFVNSLNQFSKFPNVKHFMGLIGYEKYSKLVTKYILFPFRHVEFLNIGEHDNSEKYSMQKYFFLGGQFKNFQEYLKLKQNKLVISYNNNASKFEQTHKLYYIIKIFEMLSQAEIQGQLIQDATRRINPFLDVDNKENKPTITLQCDIKLPSSHPFRSSEQIEKNIAIIENITHYSSLKQYTTSLNNKWPNSFIGLILCQHHQNNQTYYIYGTGILIHKNIVLTSAQNVYCRRMNKQYTNIRFIVGVNDNKCSGIYDVMRVNYPKEYTIQEGYENYNFCVLQLYNDLSDSCGYVGWNTIRNIREDDKYTEYGYLKGNQEESFHLRQRAKHEQQQQISQYCLRSGILFEENENKYSIVGLQHELRNDFLRVKIGNIIHEQTELIQIDLNGNNIDAQGCKFLNQADWIHLSKINLSFNNIDAQGCKYLSQYNSIYLTYINLSNFMILLQYDNKIQAQGCKYLSQANWKNLRQINLTNNKINTQGCKFLSQTNWIHLNTIDLNYNEIDLQGCKYLSCAKWTKLRQINLTNNKINIQGCKFLSQSNWIHLKQINLNFNDINAQGCKYLSQADWTHLSKIYLFDNEIDAQGCNYLSQADWAHLKQINLGLNSIGAQGCKYLSRTNQTYLSELDLYENDIELQGCKYLSQGDWTYLTTINLSANKFGTQGCKYLSQANCTQLAYISLCNENHIDDIICRLLLQQTYPNIIIQI